MQIHDAKIVRHTLRQPYARPLVAVLVCALMFSQAEQFGETLGKALYYLTH